MHHRSICKSTIPKRCTLHVTKNLLLHIWCHLWFRSKLSRCLAHWPKYITLGLSLSVFPHRFWESLPLLSPGPIKVQDIHYVGSVWTPAAWPTSLLSWPEKNWKQTSKAIHSNGSMRVERWKKSRVGETMSSQRSIVLGNETNGEGSKNWESMWTTRTCI